MKAAEVEEIEVEAVASKKTKTAKATKKTKTAKATKKVAMAPVAIKA
jgi:hypothetical protein